MGHIRSSILKLILSPGAITFRRCLLTGVFIITIATIAATTVISNSNNVSAIENIKEQNNTISLSVTTQCSFVVTDDNLDNNYEATGANGTEASFSNNNGVHNFNIACNQFSGYTVKAYAEDLVNTEDPTNTVAFYNYAEYTPRVENNSDVAIWSAEITSGGDEDEAGHMVAIFGTDEDHMEVIKSRDTASEPAGDPFSVQYHAYIGRTTAPGVYNGKAVYTITMNPYTPTTYMYSVVYHANGITGTPATQYGDTALTQDTTITLSTEIPTYGASNFLGWDTNPTASTVVYTPGQVVTIPKENPILNLYAVWDNNTIMANGATMQNMTALSCANASSYSTSGATYELVDSRDNHSYLVRKLDDGNCWMVQNLSLFARISISAANTDLNGTTEENNTFITNWNNATVVSAGANQWTNDKTVYQVYNGTYQPNAKNTTTTTNNVEPDEDSNTGSYYPFIVATAGYDTAATSGKAGESSICPKGWKLPTGGSAGQFKTLYDAYDGANGSSSTSTLQIAMNIDNAYSGYCNASYCPYANSNVYLWSSTIGNATYGYRLNADASSVNPTGGNIKYYGSSVRCVLDATTPYSYSLSFDANGGSGVPSTMSGSGVNVTDRVYLTIPNTTPTRTGYSFLGWSTDSSAATATYQPGNSFTITSSSPTVTLYAVWEEIKLYMQDTSTGTACLDLNAETGETMIAYDRRTEAGYIIGKLKDGKCWMLQNLYLEENPAGTRITLTSTDSDVSSDYTLPASSTTWGSSNTDTTGWFYQGTHKDATVDEGYTDDGDSSNDFTNTGSYFSYVVATAGLAPTTESGTAGDSVCPKNWKLPTGGASGQFKAAYDAYGAYGTFKSAFKAAYTSYCFSGGCPYSNLSAGWWSSTIYSATHGYYMRMPYSSFNPQNYGDKYYGRSVRCVFAG